MQPTAATYLTSLAPGHCAQVVALGPELQGMERRRLLDLGLTPGTEVSYGMGNPLGDPVAYRIRGALIALRASQAQHIQITPPQPCNRN
jgi:Fe2+ transport system protein FeoA